MAVVLGMLSGIGGGIVRDVLTARTPTVLLADIYAVAALAGGLVVVAGERLGVPSIASAVVGAALYMGLRLVALHRGWRLPIASPPT